VARPFTFTFLFPPAVLCLSYPSHTVIMMIYFV
jgi:hypothetical protein